MNKYKGFDLKWGVVNVDLNMNEIYYEIINFIFNKVIVLF